QGALFFEKAFTIAVTDVDEQPPVFTSAPAVTPNPGLVNQTLAFSAAIASSTPVTVTWNFGDGTSQTGASVTHAYGTAGNYSVMVTALNSASSATQMISVSVLETQNFSTQKGSLKFNFSKHLDSLTLSGPIT